MIQERNADRFVETDIALPKQVCSSCSSDNLAFAILGNESLMNGSISMGTSFSFRQNVRRDFELGINLISISAAEGFVERSAGFAPAFFVKTSVVATSNMI